MNRIIKKCSPGSTFLRQLRLLNKKGDHSNQRKLNGPIPTVAPNVYTTIKHSGKYQFTKSHHIKPDTVCIRSYKEDETQLFLQLTKKAGFDNREFDCMMAIKLDPSYLKVAVDDSDSPIGFVGLCEMPCNSLYGGQLIVKESARGQGVGKRLLHAAFERARDRNICTDAMLHLREYYGKLGFVHESFRINTYEGTVTSDCKRFKSNKTECDIVPLTEYSWSGLLQYDRSVYRGISREKILSLWLTGECVYTVVALRNGKVSGYGSFIKAGDEEYLIKLVFGDTAVVVDEILDNMLDQIPVGSILTFSILADKIVSERFINFELTAKTQRLWNKFTIKTESDKMFYICYQFI